MSKPEVVSEIFCVIKHYQQPNEPDLMLTPQVLTEWAKNPPDVAAGGGLKRKKLLMTKADFFKDIKEAQSAVNTTLDGSTYH